MLVSFQLRACAPALRRNLPAQLGACAGKKAQIEHCVLAFVSVRASLPGSACMKPRARRPTRSRRLPSLQLE